MTKGTNNFIVYTCRASELSELINHHCFSSEIFVLSAMSSNTGMKRKCLSLETKMMLIEQVDKKSKSKAEICREHNIPSSTLSTILKDRENILSAFKKGITLQNRKKIRKPENEDVDRALYVWFQQARSKNIPISGPILIEKGNELAVGLGHTNVCLSVGWLNRFKARHGIAMKVICGEGESTSKEDAIKWRENQLQDILKQYEPKDIYNADETGLFYKCVPNRTLAEKGEKCTGYKIPKDRISILLAANMVGDKLPLLTIGKCENPRCFKNVKTLPTEYKFNKKSWMTGSIFEQWLRTLDRKLLLQGRSIALIIDNCSAHPHLTDLKAIALIFLPPNTTCALQPLDQGIIHSFKMLYRKIILKKLISVIESDRNAECQINVNLLDALTMAATAWKAVKPDIIIKCFHHAGFVIKDSPTSTDSIDEDTPTIADDRTDFDNLFDRLRDIVPMTMTADDYLSLDDSCVPTAELSTQDIAQDIVGEKETVEEQEDEIGDPTPMVTTKAASDAVKTLRMFLMQQPDSSPALTKLNYFENIVDDLAINITKQTKIDSFFKPNDSASQ